MLYVIKINIIDPPHRCRDAVQLLPWETAEISAIEQHNLNLIFDEPWLESMISLKVTFLTFFLPCLSWESVRSNTDRNRLLYFSNNGQLFVCVCLEGEVGVIGLSLPLWPGGIPHNLLLHTWCIWCLFVDPCIVSSLSLSLSLFFLSPPLYLSLALCASLS